MLLSEPRALIGKMSASGLVAGACQLLQYATYENVLHLEAEKLSLSVSPLCCPNLSNCVLHVCNVSLCWLENWLTSEESGRT